MLAEQGKLALSDPLTKFLPDYPVQGRTVTVEHLLTHTSGIKSYTELKEFQPLRRKDMPVAELIAVFKDKPFDFEPGERWAYNNSGYILLGAIIEKVAGTSYEAFMQKNVFDPLGLKHTCYGSATRIIPQRIPGYGPGPNNGFANADYLSMTLPYAAGSLLSTVDDLAAWNEALLAGRLIKPETLAKAWTNYKLKDGSSTGYGYGWMIGTFEGRRLITHGGGINGFSLGRQPLPRRPSDRDHVDQQHRAGAGPGRLHGQDRRGGAGQARRCAQRSEDRSQGLRPV